MSCWPTTLTGKENKTMAKPYPALTMQRKTGLEPFHKQGTAVGFDVRSFWGYRDGNFYGAQPMGRRSCLDVFTD